MENYEPLKRRGWRRRRILTVAVVPVIVALAVWLLESGHWLVIYNDSNEALVEIHLRSGEEHWAVPQLEPRESRRLRVRGRQAAELLVEVADWAPEPPFRQLCDWRSTTITTLRLDSSHAITSTSEAGFWNRWLSW